MALKLFFEIVKASTCTLGMKLKDFLMIPSASTEDAASFFLSRLSLGVLVSDGSTRRSMSTLAIASLPWSASS
jgi:hypothetical protein